MAFIQGNGNAAASVSTLAVVLGAGTTAGNALSVFIEIVDIGNGTGTVTVSDGTNTYVVSGYGAATFGQFRYFFALNIAASITTITVGTTGIVADIYAVVAEYSNVITAGAIDPSLGAAGIGTSTSPVSGSITTTNANDLLPSAVVCDQTATISAENYTPRVTASLAGKKKLEVGDRTVSATGAYNASATLSASGAWHAGIQGLKTGTAGVATKLAFEQTPQGAWISGSAGTTQPIVQVQDAGGIIVGSDNTTQVVATITRGSGALVGTATVTCVSGRAVFTNLGLSQTTLADDIFNITFSKVGGGLTAVVSSNIFVCSASAQPAALPATFLNTAMPTRTGAATRVSAANLQAAMNAASPGDWLILDHTATYTGDFTFPAKAGADAAPGGNAVIVIISDAIYDFGFLPANKRVSNLDATNMPKIRTNSANGIALSTTNGIANMKGWRLVGLDIAPTVGNTADLTRIVRFGDETTLVSLGANQSANFGVDRCYVHCDNATQNIQHGVSVHSSASFVIDSYIENIHHNGADAQAIWAGNSPGPVKIVNNFAEATGENIFVGGSDGIDGQPIVDVEVRYNFMFKRKTWNPADPSYAGVLWVVKNIFEIKFGRRILVEGNILDGIWNGAQVGFAMNLKSNNNQAIPTTDVTVRYNLIRNAAGLFNLNGQLADTAPPGSFPPWMARLNIHDNLVYNMAGAIYDASNQVGMLAQNLEHIADLVLNHNSGMPPRFFINLNDPSVPYNIRPVFTNNLGSRGASGVKCGGQIEGSASLAAVTTPSGSYTFAGNVLATSNGGNSGSAGYPAGNFFPADVPSIGLVDSTLVTSGALTPGSAYKNQGLDGTDPGVDWPTLASTIALTVGGDRSAGGGGVASGRWPKKRFVAGPNVGV